MRKLLPLVVVLVALAAGTSGAATGGWKPVTEKASRGQVAATFTYETNAATYETRHLRISVSRAGKVAYDRGLKCPYCQPNGSPKSPALQLQNVWGTDEPEVVLGLWSGGASCCYETLLLVHRPSGYAATLHSWGRDGYRGRWRTGTYYFLSADPAFVCEFAACVFGGGPAQAWAFDRSGKLRDVTRTRPDYVRADASLQWREYLKERGGKDGVRAWLAAYCADEYLLGAGARCESALTAAAAAGYLSKGVTFESPAAYVKHLHRFLRAHGYIA